ncbi:tubulin-specific chaperone-like protein B [Microthyrium microscopicum]|uniref:Tubulin-specific chaperone-like protein B n=1 Tax=Microthyrium microscopicum TaxID=703497 RepID=A0A6A6UK65_9PEZI|nr:tubulin-specific chaperone-like protein B [Microthyrium microscopicum]
MISSPNTSSERRVSPAWTIAQFKTRLEPITGVPASAQQLRLGSVPLQANDEESTLLSTFSLQPYAELHVIDTRPKNQQTNYNDVSAVDKYNMPAPEYEARTDSVLAWKKAQHLGRFDPNAGTIEEQKVRAIEREIEERHIKVGARCALLPSSDARRGTVAFVGPVEQIPGLGAWVGVALDEPTGKNDGSVGGQRYFTCAAKSGVFVRPERVEVGDFAVLDDLGEEFEEM